jgi:predicted Zn-dependent protease
MELPIPNFIPPSRIWLAAVFSVLLGCSSSTKSITTEVNFSQDVFVTQGNDARQEFHKGDKLLLSSEPALFESPGHVGVLIIPMSSRAVAVPKLKPIEDWSSETFDHTLNAKLNLMVGEITKIQSLLATKKQKEALERIEALQKQFPKVSYLQFLRASTLYMGGEKEKARIAIERGLKDFPDNQDAWLFYKALGGEMVPRQPASLGTSKQEKKK